MFDTTNMSILSAIVLSIVCVAITIVIIKINGKSDLMISKNGVIVKAKSPRKITSKAFVSYMKEVITYIEEAKEQYVDDVIGIKNRYFKQSKDFAKSRIESVKNDIIEEYKLMYMAKYSGRIHPSALNEHGETIIETTAILPTKIQSGIGTDKPNSPCFNMCTSGCNSGLSFFDSRLQKDFKPILEEVYRIIEENHLVNRADREYEEEIMSKAEQLSSYLKNTIISYPVPIDNEIAKQVIDKRCHEVKEAIADSLRRSRTLSITKRDAINVEKKRYIERRDRQIAQIINILNEEDTAAILDNVTNNSDN